MPYKSREDRNRYAREYWRKHHKTDRVMPKIPFDSKTQSQEYQRAWANMNKRRNPIKVYLNRLKCKSKRLNLDFDLTEEDFPESPICPIYNTPLSYSPDEKRQKYKASVDRVDNTRGYTKDNVCIISRRANTVKSDCSLQEIENVLEYMEKGLLNNQPRVPEIFKDEDE